MGCILKEVGWNAKLRRMDFQEVDITASTREIKPNYT